MRDLIIFIALILFASQKSAAQVLASQMPSSFSQNQSTLIQRGMGNACLATSSVQDGLPCSPSFIGMQDKNEFIGSIYLGNGYTALQATNSLLYQPITKDYLKSLFSNNNVMEMEANGQLTFLTKYFAAQFDPYHVTYFSEISNPAYPTIALHAMNEKSFNFMGGSQITDGLYWGSNVRFVTRTFIQKEFSLFEAVTTDPNVLLAPQTQNAIYVEPAVTYYFDNPWKPRVTVMAQNTGFVDQQYDQLNYYPQPAFGFGFQPPVRWGVLEFDIDYKNTLGTGEFSDNIYFGSSYKLGAMQAVLGLNSQSFSSGVVFTMSGLQVGIVYSSTKLPGMETDYYDQTVYTQFGVHL